MRHVEVEHDVDGVDADTLFGKIADFRRYPEIAESVRSVEVDDSDPDGTLSQWEVDFRNGVLKWQEKDVIESADRHISFDQVEGDLNEFKGEWRVEGRDGGATIYFEADFDLGIPSLQPLLEPVAERALLDNVSELVDAFVGDAGGEIVERRKATGGDDEDEAGNGDGAAAQPETIEQH